VSLRALALVLLALGCRSRANAPADARVTRRDGATTNTSSYAGVALPVQSGTQPRWRYLAHGPRPHGTERWRFDLTPRDAWGEPATDGTTVFVTAARGVAEGLTDGELYAFDLRDGTLRWHVPVGGVHDAPVEVFDGTVFVDTIPHCRTFGAYTPGVTLRPCLENAPGGLVAFDASTGQERARIRVAPELQRSLWTVIKHGDSLWTHDGVAGLRAINPVTLALGARIVTGGRVLNLTSNGDDLHYTVESRGTTRLVAHSPHEPRARWERTLPLRSLCPVLTADLWLVLPAFSASNVAGAARGVRPSDGSDLWVASDVPTLAQGCAVIDGAAFDQVIDGAVVASNAGDGHVRGRFSWRGERTSELSVALDGVFYLGLRERLAGIELAHGAEVFSLRTGAVVSGGMVLWGGRGVVVTRQPGLVVGFE
jgi:outer membrane protein assembly factor BamB